MQPLSSAEKQYLQEWLEVADLDFGAAQRMLADAPAAYGYLIPFAFQQSVEKYCKGVFLVNGLPFPKSHDLPDLMTKLPVALSFTHAELDDADQLADYAVQTRYPPNTRVTSAEMREAGRIAAHFRSRFRPLIETGLQ